MKMSSAQVSIAAKGDDSPIEGRELFFSHIRGERERADRTGQVLSLAILKLNCIDEVELSDAIKSLRHCIRSIDSIGWFDDERVGVLLPATDRGGADQFIVRTSKLCSEHSIYTYPDQWAPEYLGGSSKRRNESGDEATDPEAIFMISTPLWKRSLDIFGSLLGLAILWPLLLFVAIYIKVVSPGPALFRQQRVGKGGKLFTFYKFRTMKANNNEGEHQIHIVSKIRTGGSLEKFDDYDSRIIPGGRVIRKACIDELPQLINIIKGDMSLVGPRPCVPYEAREYALWHTHRFDLVPGLTGLWQVSGKNKLTLAQMIRLDIAYANSLSLGNDLKIILRTLPAIISMLVESVKKRAKNKMRSLDNAMKANADKNVEDYRPSLSGVPKIV